MLKRIIAILAVTVFGTMGTLVATQESAQAAGTCSWTTDVVARGGGWNTSGYWISGNMYTGCDQIRGLWHYSFNVNTGSTTPDRNAGFMRAKVYRSNGTSWNGPWKTAGDRSQIVLINTGDVGIGVRYRIQFIPPCPYCTGEWYPLIDARD